MKKSVKVKVKGISAIIMHSFPMEPIENPPLEKRSIEEQAELAAYRDPQTKGLYIPGINIQRSLIAGSAYSKGKGRASLQKQAAACLVVSPERVPFTFNGKPLKTYEIDSRPVVIKATGGRIMRHRPRLDEWEAQFEIEYDDSLLTEKQLRQIVEDSISRVGWLDFRPEKKGPFGRSMITEWQ
jgi:hypothetical protein